MSIDQIEQTSIDAQVNTIIAIADSCEKCGMIMEMNNDIDTSQYSIFQEGSVIEKALRPADENESTAKTLLLFPLRLIKAICDVIASKFSKKKRLQLAAENFMDGTFDEKDIELIKKERSKSPIYKAIVAAGLTCAVTTTGMLAFEIRDYSPAVEFKDDVKFQISPDGQLRIMFPYYRIDQIKTFNAEADKLLKQKPTEPAKKQVLLGKLSKELDKVVINQTKVSERDFDLSKWDKYFEEVKNTYDTFSDILKQIGELEKMSDGSKIVSSITNSLNAYLKKIPGDLELITKLDDKIRVVYKIITDNSSSKRKKKKYSKYTFTPIPKEKLVDIYKFDTFCIQNAIKEFNLLKKDLDNRLFNNDAMFYAYTEHNDHYRSGLSWLEQQFNAVIDFKMTDGGGYTIPVMASNKFEDITISKTRGFDLHKATLTIANDPLFVYRSTQENDKPVFGQMLTGIICHEIFHNIAALCKIYNSKLIQVIKDVYYKAEIAFSAILKMLNAILKNYNNRISSIFKKTNEPSKEVKEKTIKRLLYLIKHREDDALLSDFAKKVMTDTDDGIINKIDTKKIADEIDVDIKTIKTEESKSESLKVTALWASSMAGACLSAILNRYNLMTGGILAISSIFAVGNGLIDIKMEGTNEEAMCDMCAAIYKLPVYLHDVKDLIKNGKKREIAANSHNRHDVHPSTYDRQSVSYRLAKEILNSGEPIDNETRDYLEFIISKNKDIDKTERHLTKKQMKKAAPEFTEDISRAISNFVAKHNIPVTEAYVWEDDEYE